MKVKEAVANVENSDLKSQTSNMELNGTQWVNKADLSSFCKRRGFGIWSTCCCSLEDIERGYDMYENYQLL